MNHSIRAGSTVRYRRNDVETTAVVVKIERCPRRGDMFGQVVDELPWSERSFGFFTLDKGFCHGRELVQ
jgi:hypothetical protein